jgi:hypothetical protein
MRCLLSLVAVIILIPAKANALSAESGRWDYAYSFGLRSQPVGLGLWGELGYSHLLWGSKPSAENSFYGYIRPKISAQTSGKVNRSDIGVDLAFWAPIVFELSYGLDHRSGTFSQFDCDQLQCEKLLIRKKAAVKLSAGYAGFFLFVDSLMEQVTGPRSPEKDFGDQSWSLAGTYPKDLLLNSQVTLGRKVTETLSVGVLGSVAEFQESKEWSKNLMGFVSIRNSGLQYFIGAGHYESSRIQPGFTSSFGLKWVGSDSFSVR